MPLNSSLFTRLLLLPRFHSNLTFFEMSNRAAFVDSPKGPIVVRDTEVFEPEQGEVQIKVHSCAIQPIDAKVARLGIMPLEYPAILGSQVAGVISAVGADVTTFSVGDRVVGTTKAVAQKKAKFGGLQRFAILDASGLVEVSEGFQILMAKPNQNS